MALDRHQQGVHVACRIVRRLHGHVGVSRQTLGGTLAIIVALLFTPPVAAEVPSPAPAAIRREISLRDLGLEKGVDFSGLSGYRELFFPVPYQGVRSAVLRLNLRWGAAFPGQRLLQVSAGGRVLLSRAITENEAAEPISLPIDPILASEGFIRIALRYSGALNSDLCIEERVSGDHLAVLPDTALDLRLIPETLSDVRTLARMMPRDVLLVLPSRELDRGEIAATLRAASVLRRRGATVALADPGAIDDNYGRSWSHGIVLIGRAEDFPEITSDDALPDVIAAVHTPAGPAFLVGGGESATAALPVLNSRWLALADSPLLSVNQLGAPDSARRSLTLEDLGVGLLASELVERVQFDIPFTSDQLPRGMSLGELRLDMAVGAAPGNGEAAIFAFLNGRLLGSRNAVPSVPTTLSLAVPEGVAGRDNTLTLRFQRPPLPGACVKHGPGQPVQLLPTSTLELIPDTQTPHEFFQLPQAFRAGLDIVLPAEPARTREALAHLIDAGVDLLPDDAPLTIRLEPRPATGERPFILVSRQEPADTDPRLRFDRGTLAITRGDGRLLVDIANPNVAPTVAQVLRTDKAVGLWLRPSQAVGEARTKPVRLDRGDIALLDQAGIALAFSTERKQLAAISYYEIRSWQDLAGEYRPWIVAVVWLLIAALFVRALTRAYRRRGAG